jgi:hypothetical protein
MPAAGPRKVTKEQREEMTRRVLAGETAASIAKDYGVTRAYVALLKAQALDPERFARKAEEKLSRKLSREEMKKFVEILSTSTPELQGLIPAREKWSLEHGHQLVWNLFQKKASVRLLKETMEPYIPKRSEFRFTRPQPPKPHHINQIDPELAKDPDYVAYYLSPICEQIAWREYEMALADWEERFAHEEEPREDGEPADFKVGHHREPGQRVGKHAKSKGSPFTPPKRRKKRR